MTECKTCAGTGFIKVQRGEMYCPNCLRTGGDAVPVNYGWREEREVITRSRPARRSRTEEREVNIQGGELYD